MPVAWKSFTPRPVDRGAVPLSEERKREMFKAVDAVLRENPEVGAYNQSI